MYKDPVAGGKRFQITSHVTYKTDSSGNSQDECNVGLNKEFCFYPNPLKDFKWGEWYYW